MLNAVPLNAVNAVPYNASFINLLDKLSGIMMKHGEPFRAKAYQKAQESIMTYPSTITSLKQLEGLPGIGPTIMEKFKEYLETGTLRILEQEKTNPINILTDVYAIGPKKAEELVKAGVKTIADLRIRQDELLNDIQKVGLEFYEDILQRIPRQEIEEYKGLLKSVAKSDNAFEIVGSYRRGAENSGDIDIIITGETGLLYKELIDELIKRKIILHVLSRGPVKTLVIAKLPGKSIARRLDFLYAPPNEYAFALLYFTGSKIFNTVMRQKALNQGYTLNEHGICHLTADKKKGEPVLQPFPNEKSIFDFLQMLYKTPLERSNMDVVSGSESANLPASLEPSVKKPKNKTLKKKVTKSKAISNADTSKADTIIFEIIEDDDDDEDEDDDDDDDDDEAVGENMLIQTFVKQGTPFLNTLSLANLEHVLQYASKQYYNHNPVLTDNQFDIIKNFIDTKFPTNKATKEIGAEVERNKVLLPFEMASMDKIKPDTGALANWCQKFAGPYVLSCKLDGVSGLFTLKSDSSKQLFTRGNGSVGQEVSHLIPYLGLPTNTQANNENIAIRGEFIMSKQVFKAKYANKFANIRNMVAGIINSKTIIDAVKDLDFVAYELIEPALKPSEQLALLKQLGIKTVLSLNTNKLTNESLSGLLVDWRQNYQYEIDGVIVTNDAIAPRVKGNPEHAFAFKMVLSDQIAEAIVTDVIWTPSKDGYLKPRVQIEPLNLGGVKIEYATGFNGAFIRDNKVGVGATIELIRSGDVIPHIKSIIVCSAVPKMPDVPYQWNATGVDVMLINAAEDPTVKEKNITGFFKGIEVDGLGGGNICRIIESGYDTVPKIIKMSINDLLKVDGFKDKMASKVYTGIQEKLHKATLTSLMAASNIFGRGFSDKKLELILGELPDILVSCKTTGQKVAAVAAIKGMAEKTAATFVAQIEEFKAFLKDCGLENKQLLTNAAASASNALNALNASNPLYKKTVVLTGTRDKQVIEFLRLAGAIQGATVSKNTFLVVAKSADDDTGKAEDARKLGIPILSVEQFLQKYN
jgi:DNA ligase (NAD+)